MSRQDYRKRRELPFRTAGITLLAEQVATFRAKRDTMFPLIVAELEKIWFTPSLTVEAARQIDAEIKRVLPCYPCDHDWRLVDPWPLA